MGVKFPRATRLFLGDVAGEGIADALDVVLDRGELALLVIDHRADAVIQDRLDLGDCVLQRVNGRGSGVMLIESRALLRNVKSRQTMLCCGGTPAPDRAQRAQAMPLIR